MSLAIVTVLYHVEIGNPSLGSINIIEILTRRERKGGGGHQISVFQSNWLFEMCASKSAQLNAMRERVLEKQREVIYSC